jgi:hypothetical protein
MERKCIENGVGSESVFHGLATMSTAGFPCPHSHERSLPFGRTPPSRLEEVFSLPDLCLELRLITMIQRQCPPNSRHPTVA